MVVAIKFSSLDGFEIGERKPEGFFGRFAREPGSGLCSQL